MFAVTAARIDADNPLAGLDLGERPDPSPPDDWATVTVKAASLNHHDIWTLRGVGISPDRLPVVLGCDAAGVDENGNEVVVHAVIGDPALAGGDVTPPPRRALLSRPYDRNLPRRGLVPPRHLGTHPAALRVRSAVRLPTPPPPPPGGGVWNHGFTDGGAPLFGSQRKFGRGKEAPPAAIWNPDCTAVTPLNSHPPATQSSGPERLKVRPLPKGKSQT